MFALGQFFQTRGVQNVLTSRIFLIIAVLFPVIWVWQIPFLLKSKRWKWAAALITAVLLVGTYFLDRAFPLPGKGATVAAVKHSPLITVKIHPSAFPVSVPPRTTLHILPLHPFQTFTDSASQLHEYENDCPVDRPWPSDKEIASKPANSYEEVRSIEITNHGQGTMESGRIVFEVRYNKSFAGECAAPPQPTQSQQDVISVPTLDQGQTFSFVSVNQTDGCAWLTPPDSMRVKMAGDDAATDVPVKLEAINVPNWIRTPFGPTAVKWEGVPTKNPGYGIVRSGAECKSPIDDQKRREIQEYKLARLIREGIVLKSKWSQVMMQPEEIQRVDSSQVRAWHAEIEAYLRTLPRGDIYLAKLNSRTRTDFGYPIGINMNVAGNWDQLILDLASLNEFMKDPDFGNP